MTTATFPVGSRYGWHFVGASLRDGSPVLPDGEWLPEIADPVLCVRGYHGSRNPFDALRYAPGDTLCLCEYRGEMIEEGDKFVASERRIICRMDATEMLQYFARMQALSVVHLWDAPDVVLDWLMTGDGALRLDAASAARAARDAAYTTSAYATLGAAYATLDAAYAADRYASDAAYTAYTTSAYATLGAAYATLDAASDEFNALVAECFEGPLSNLTI